MDSLPGDLGLTYVALYHVTHGLQVKELRTVPLLSCRDKSVVRRTAIAVHCFLCDSKKFAISLCTFFEDFSLSVDLYRFPFPE